MSSPDPMVSEAMMAPGPKTVSHRAELAEGSGGEWEVSSLIARSMPTFLKRSEGSHERI